nr:MAG: hypothetical protein [Microvirus sp.]
MAKNLPVQDPCLPGIPPISPSDMATVKLMELADKRIATIERSIAKCEDELAVIRDVPGFESRVKYLDCRVKSFRVELSKLFSKG